MKNGIIAVLIALVVFLSLHSYMDGKKNSNSNLGIVGTEQSVLANLPTPPSAPASDYHPMPVKVEEPAKVAENTTNSTTNVVVKVHVTGLVIK